MDASVSIPPRPAARSFRDLLVWRKAPEFVLAVYAYTVGLPKQETYGLALQMRRAASRFPPISPKGFADAARRIKRAT